MKPKLLKCTENHSENLLTPSESSTAIPESVSAPRPAYRRRTHLPSAGAMVDGERRQSSVRREW